MKKYLVTIVLLLSAALAHAAIDWQDCTLSPYDFPYNPHGQLCATLDVPLSYRDDNRSNADPQGRTVTLALSKLPAQEEKSGTLVFIMGGPGQSGMYPIENIDALYALHENFDLIFYDARGVGLSTPRITCRDSRGDIPEKAQDFVRACLDGTPAHFLPHIGSHEAANDLDHIRQALGETQINLIGYSYGSKIAALYALRFPAQVRAAILDGAVDIFESPFSMRLHQEKGYQTAFAAFIAHCRKNPPCPFAGDPADSTILRPLILQNALLQSREKAENARWQTRWEQNLRNGTAVLDIALGGAFHGDFSELEHIGAKNPLPDDGDLLDVLYGNLMWEEDWPVLDNALRSYLAGEPDIINTLNAHMEDIREALTAINCADTAYPSSEGENRILQRRLQHRAPYDNLLYDPDERTLLDPCGYWPHIGSDYRTSLPVQAPSDLPPLLFIAQRHDPATPWANAQRMAAYFDSPLITLEGYGHTISFSDYNVCIDAVALDYLLQPHHPPRQTVCTKPPEEIPRHHIYPLQQR